MRSFCLGLTVAVFALALGSRHALAEDPAPAETPRDLAKAVAGTKVSLRRSMDYARSDRAVPLEAAFALSPTGDLALTMLVRLERKAGARFERWVGRVYGDNWIPRRVRVEATAAVAKAEQLYAVLSVSKRSIGSILPGPRDNRQGSAAPLDVVTSVWLTQVGDALHATTRVALRTPADPATAAQESTLYTELTTDLATGEVVRSTRVDAPGPLADNTPFQPLVLPPLVVPGGLWRGTESPPTLETLKGRGTLVAITDPG